MRETSGAYLWPTLLAALLSFIFRIGQHHLDLNLGDEGFLWYGAQRLLQGELPLRDFQAYDPGRYFWAAGWMWLLGDDGLIALRWSLSVLAAITVGLVTWTIRPAGGHVGLALCASGLMLSLWIGSNRFGTFDAFALALLLLGLTRLFEAPSALRWLQVGLCWGVATTIGINHGLYGAVAGLLAFLLLRGAPGPLSALGAVAVGAVAGYAPVLALHALSTGYSQAFLDSIILLFESGSTNITMPLPRPWAFLDLQAANPWHPGQQSYWPVVESLMAIVLAAVPMLWIFAGRRLLDSGSRAGMPPATVAGLLLSIPYAHYFLSRAEPLHLAVSLLPVLAAAMAWVLAARPSRSWAVLAPLLAFSLPVIGPTHAASDLLRGRYTATTDVDGASLRVSPVVAAHVAVVRQVAREAAPGQFFAGPYLPAAYALTRTKSPTWEIFLIFPATPSRQRAEVDRLRAANVRHAIINLWAIDQRPDLGLERTHPLVMAYFAECRTERETTNTLLPLMIVRPTAAACT